MAKTESFAREKVSLENVMRKESLTLETDSHSVRKERRNDFATSFFFFIKRGHGLLKKFQHLNSESDNLQKGRQTE